MFESEGIEACVATKGIAECIAVLSKCWWVENDEVVFVLDVIEILEGIDSVGFVARVAREVEFDVFISQFDGLSRAIDRVDKIGTTTHGVEREATSVAEHIEHVATTGIMLEKRAVVALVDEEASFLAIEPVGMELESVFESDGFGFIANEVAIDWFYWSLEWHSAFGFVIDVVDSRDDFDKEFGNDVFGIVHTDRVGLNDGCVAIDVDDEAREIVALAMHEAVGIGGVGIGKTEREAHVVGSL